MSLKPSAFLVTASLLAQLASASFALVDPSRTAALSNLPATPERDAAIRAAGHQLAHAPHPIRTIHTEGTLPHQGIRDEH